MYVYRHFNIAYVGYVKQMSLEGVFYSWHHLLALKKKSSFFHRRDNIIEMEKRTLLGKL